SNAVGAHDGERAFELEAFSARREGRVGRDDLETHLLAEPARIGRGGGARGLSFGEVLVPQRKIGVRFAAEHAKHDAAEPVQSCHRRSASSLSRRRSEGSGWGWTTSRDSIAARSRAAWPSLRWASTKPCRASKSSARPPDER